MKRIAATWLIVGAVLAAPLVAGAQAPSPAPAAGSQERRVELARRLLVATDAQGTMRRLMSTMADGFSRGMATGGDGTEISKILEQVMREELSSFGARTMPLMADIYADTFDEQELRDLLAFYESPAGRKMVEKLPELSRRSQAAAAPFVPVMQRQMVSKLFTRICEVKHCTDDELRAMERTEKLLIQQINAQSAAEPTT